MPLVYRRTLRSIEEIIVSSMTAAFYVNNAARNTHLVERQSSLMSGSTTGICEKPACFNPVHAIYDLIFAAGQAGIDRYARHGVRIPAEKFMIVGRPQVELITPARAPIGTIRQPTVLYAPTWQGPFADSRVYSLPVRPADRRAAPSPWRAGDLPGPSIQLSLSRRPKMIEEIGAVMDADREVSGREHLWGAAAELQMSVEDCFNASDAMVSDVSAVVSDYLHSGQTVCHGLGGTYARAAVDRRTCRPCRVRDSR